MLLQIIFHRNITKLIQKLLISLKNTMQYLNLNFFFEKAVIGQAAQNLRPN